MRVPSTTQATAMGPVDTLAPRDPAAWKTAQDFEGMALGQLLAPIFDTVKPAKGIFGGGEGEETWRPMLTQELAKQIAKSGGLGLAEPIYRQIMLLQQQADSTKTGTSP